MDSARLGLDATSSTSRAAVFSTDCSQASWLDSVELRPADCYSSRLWRWRNCWLVLSWCPSTGLEHSSLFGVIEGSSGWLTGWCEVRRMSLESSMTPRWRAPPELVPCHRFHVVGIYNVVQATEFASGVVSEVLPWSRAAWKSDPVLHQTPP